MANKGSKRYYIQSAYLIPDEEKREQEIRSLLRIGDSFKKIVITSHAPAPLYDSHGILTMSIYGDLSAAVKKRLHDDSKSPACRTPKDLTAFPPDKAPVKTGQGFGAEV